MSLLAAILVVASGSAGCAEDGQGIAYLPSSSQPPAASVAEPISKASLDEVDSLRDLRGNLWSVAALPSGRAYVLAFLGVDCPHTRARIDRLVELHRQFAPQGVWFVGVFSGQQESVDDIARFTLRVGLPFTVVKDHGQRLAEQLAVTSTPAVRVFDANRKLCYAGGIDDRSEARDTNRSDPDFLATLLNNLLSGRPIGRAATSVAGSKLERGSGESAGRIPSLETVATLFERRCLGCHCREGVAPFAFERISDLVRWRAMIREVVHQRRMPPWQPDPEVGQFRNSRRLTDEEVSQIVSWIDAGLPVGGPATPDRPLVPAATEVLRESDCEVAIDCPDEFEVPAAGVIPLKRALVASAVTERLFPQEVWVRAARIVPGHRSITHHVLVYLMAPGSPTDSGDELSGDLVGLVGWVPGDPDLRFPEDVALRIPARTRIAFEVHYVPDGQFQRDRPRLLLDFAPQSPSHELRLAIIGRESFEVPPREPHFHASVRYQFRRPIDLLGVIPHMHQRGKAAELTMIHPSGEREKLLSVPRYDFNWQNCYWFDAPKVISPGASLLAEGWWDNSGANMANPNPDVPAASGEMGDAEMFHMYAYYRVPRMEGNEYPLESLGTDGEVVAEPPVTASLNRPLPSNRPPLRTDQIQPKFGSGELGAAPPASTLGADGPEFGSGKWHLVVPSGARAQPISTSDPIRLRIDQSGPVNSGGIRLVHHGPGTDTGRSWSIAYRIYSEKQRTIRFGLATGEEGATWISAPRNLSFSAGWNTGRLELTVLEGSRNIAVRIDTGEADGILEVKEFRVRSQPHSGSTAPNT